MPSEHEPRTVERSTLYDEVWSAPMTRIAERYGVSDVGLAKICKRHSIPRPPQGYWVKLAHGKSVDRPPLPPAASPELELVQLPETPTVGAAPEPVLRVEEIPVPERIGRFHPLVSATRRALRGAWVRDGLLVARGGGVLDAAVSSKQQPRALRILHVLIKALEARGHAVVVEERDYEPVSTYAVISRQYVRFRIREILRQAPHELTASEKKSAERGYEPGGPKYDNHPTGQLRLEVTSWCRERMRRRWNDTSRKPLDDQLSEVLAGLELFAKKLAEREAEERAAEAQRQAEAEARAERERLDREEAERVAQLRRDALAWEEAERIRRFAQVVESAADPELPASERTALEAWKGWARSVADRLDPTWQ